MLDFLIIYFFIGLITAFSIDVYIDKEERRLIPKGVGKTQFKTGPIIFGFVIWPIYWTLVLISFLYEIIYGKFKK